MTEESTSYEPGELLDAARRARGNAYAPYSGFAVGAALLDDAGRIHLGVNVENASYGLATCAERSAVACAVTSGARSFRALAVIGPRDDEPCMPCGSCRQILFEFSPDLEIIVAAPNGTTRIVRLAELLPQAFRLDTPTAGRFPER